MELSLVTSGAHDKLFTLNEPALHRAEDYLIQSEGTKLFRVRLLPDLFILKKRFKPGPERKKSCWVGIGLGGESRSLGAILSPTDSLQEGGLSQSRCLMAKLERKILSTR